MSVKTFVDSNILIYAHDVRQGDKHAVAMRLVYDLIESRTIAVSPQVLQEFYVNATRKIARPVPKPVAREIIEDLAVWSIETGPGDIATAFRIEDEAKISFWDALICASALKAGARIVLSEDLNSGQRIAGMQIENPFTTRRA